MRFGLKETTIEAIHTVLAGFPEVEEAVLYGSRAKGNYKPGSDIDLTLKGGDVTWETACDIRGKLDESFLPYMFDISAYTQIDNPDLIAHIDRVGTTFYRKESE